MLSFMHQGSPYGYLTLPATGKDTLTPVLRPILPHVLARMVGGSTEDVERLLGELEDAGVFSRTDDGIIFSRRMVQDEKLRETRASGGANSLSNPNVPRPKRDQKDTLEGSLGGSLAGSFGGSPSSSSSSSKNNTSEQKISSDSGALPLHKTSSKQPSQDACRLAALLKSEILKNKADYRVTPAQERRWATTAQRMLDIDKREPQAIADLIRWVQRDEFWMANVLSMDTLREKFDQLELKRNHLPSIGRPPAVVALPANYIPPSEQIRRERAGASQ